MRVTKIKEKKDEDGQREYTITLLKPYDANDLPGKGATLEDLINIGLFPVMQLVDVLGEIIGDGIERGAEIVLLEQIRKSLIDVENSLYRYDEGTAWNIPKEWEPVFEKLDVIPVDKISEVQKAIEQDQKNRREILPADAIDHRMSELTPREREIMELLVSGLSMKKIASRLKISLPTCSKHRTKVLEKLSVDNDVQLVLRVHAWKAPQT